MKYVLVFGLLLSIFSCKKDANGPWTCVCSEIYNGALKTESKVLKDSILVDMKKEDAACICDNGDTTQTILTETWSIDCELK